MVEIVKLPPIPTRFPKEVLEKSRFFKGKKSVVIVKPNIKQLCAQVTNLKIFNILKIKEDFLNLLVNKIENIYKIINNSRNKKQKL